MTDPRDPRQVKQLDRISLRRIGKSLLPPTMLYDDHERDEVIDQSNQSARSNSVRAVVLRRALRGGDPWQVLADSERLALDLFVLGEGPRPRFAKLGSDDGHFGAHWLRDDDPDRPAPAAPWPATLPGDPNRYVKPKGDYAIPGVDA
jgi:hypothetical protein